MDWTPTMSPGAWTAVVALIGLVGGVLIELVRQRRNQVVAAADAALSAKRATSQVMAELLPNGGGSFRDVMTRELDLVVSLLEATNRATNANIKALGDTVAALSGDVNVAIVRLDDQLDKFGQRERATAATVERVESTLVQHVIDAADATDGIRRALEDAGGVLPRQPTDHPGDEED